MGVMDWLARTQRRLKNFGPHAVKINARRITRGITGTREPPLAIAVDLDGTLLDAESMHAMAENTGWAREYEKLCDEVESGRKHLNPAMKESFERFARCGAGDAEWRELAEKAFENSLNEDLVNGLKEIQAHPSRPKIILATRSHRAFAERIAELLREKGVRVDGVVASGKNGGGFEVIGSRESRLGKTVFKTKPQKARELYLQKWGIPLQRTAMITDSAHDADSIAGFGGGVLYLNGGKRNYAHLARLYDYGVIRRGEGERLPALLGFTREGLKPRPRLR